MKQMCCPKCKSTNVNVQMLEIHKNRGCLASLFAFTIKLILFFIWVALWLISLLIQKSKKTKLKKFAVCNNCGYHWQI